MGIFHAHRASPRPSGGVLASEEHQAAYVHVLGRRGRELLLPLQFDLRGSRLALVLSSSFTLDAVAVKDQVELHYGSTVDYQVEGQLVPHEFAVADLMLLLLAGTRAAGYSLPGKLQIHECASLV